MNDLGYIYLMSLICRKQALEYAATIAEQPKQTSSIRARARRAVSRLLSTTGSQRAQQRRDLADRAATGTSSFIV